MSSLVGKELLRYSDTQCMGNSYKA